MFEFSNRFRRNFRDTRGISLVVALGLVFLMSLMAAGVMKIVLSFMHTTHQVERANIAYSAAEGGVELAIYDLLDYEDGYQTDASSSICGEEGGVGKQEDDFSDSCDDNDPYRFVDFTADGLSGGKSFWRLFARTLESEDDDHHFIPNPYFAGDRDDTLEFSNGSGINEWGELTKSSPLSLSLLIDESPDEPDPDSRFTWIVNLNPNKIVFDPGLVWDAGGGEGDEEPIFTWTLSALASDGEEYTLQGVAWESDFEEACEYSEGTHCFVFDLADNDLHNPSSSSDGDVYAGEDINRNLDSSSVTGFNRVSGIEESFLYQTPQQFIDELNDDERIESVRFTINLIATLSETSDVPSNSLRYRLESGDEWADEYTYIVSEGFAGMVKQTIETRFKRDSAIPIFSYVIFQ